MGPDIPELGEQDRCPHCNGLTVVREHDELWWVCGVCGGPRIPIGKGEELTTESKRALEQANDQRARAAIWRYASFAGFFGALLGVGLGSILIVISIVSAIIPAALGIVLAIVALGWRKRARALAQGSREAWERAWDRAIEHVLVASSGSPTLAQIARRMKVPEEAIETIAARLSSSDRVRVDVGEDAELRIRATLQPAELEQAHEEPRQKLETK